MGCNGSKTNDFQADRQRVARKPEPRPTQTGRNSVQQPTKGIAIGSGQQKDTKEEGDGETVYPGSYTAQKTVEYEFLHNIVQQTRGNFIDVSSKATDIDESDAAERTQKYIRKLESVGTTKSVLLNSLFDLPTSCMDSVDMTSLADLLGTASISLRDVETAAAAAQAISASIERIVVKDVGKVVLTFEEL